MKRSPSKPPDQFISIHGLDDPLVHVISGDSRGLVYGRHMNVNVYTNASGGRACGVTVDTEGQYVVRLTASSSETCSSRNDTLLAEVDDGLAKAPLDLSFNTGIKTRLAARVSACHSMGAQSGIPVGWVDDGIQPLAIPANDMVPPSLEFYEQVRARVNLDFLEDSLILEKPSHSNHFGGLRYGFDTSLDVGANGRADYDVFVSWIAEGASRGVVDARCPGTN